MNAVGTFRIVHPPKSRSGRKANGYLTAEDIRSKMAFKRLVRFTLAGEAHYGDLISEEKNSWTVKKLNGDAVSGFKASNEEPVVVNKVMSIEKKNVALRLSGNPILTN